MNAEGDKTKQSEVKAQKQEAQFDPNKTPVDLDVAINHGKSKRIGFVGNVSSLDPVKDICPCCGNVISKFEVDLNVKLTDLGFLGSGVPLYYFFIKFCVMFLFLIGLVSSIYNIISNSKGSTCKKIPNCNPDAFSNKLGVINRDDPLDKINTTAGLNLLCTVCLIVASLILRRKMKNLNNEIDIDNVTPSDFTIMVTNIPKSCTDAEILDYFMRRTKNFPNMKIEKIVQAYDISFYIEKKRLKQSLAAQKIKEQNNLNLLAQTESDKMREIDAQIAEVDVIIEQQESSMSQDSFLSCGTAFVTFSSDVGCQRVVKMFNKGLIHRLMSYVLEANKLKGHVLKVRRAPEPTDIYWENLCYSAWDRFRSKLITYILSTIILTGCFFIIYGISIGQNSLSETNVDSVWIQILGLIISLCIFFINSGISLMIKKFALFEKHQTLTNYYIAVALKSGIAQFLNTTIIVYIVKRIKWDSKIYASGGLLSSLNFLMLMNFVFLFSYIWNPWTLLKLFKRRKLKSIGSAAQANTPQYKAHEIFEGNKFDFAQNFAKIIKILMFASFYAYAYPLLIYVSLGTVIVAYWIDKYYLLRICSIPDMLSQALPYAMSDFFLELFIIIFNVGNLVFEKLLYDKQNGMTIAALVLSVIFWVFDFEAIGECMDCIIQKQAQPIKEYNAYSYQFLTDYERTNPITAMRAIEEWQKKLKDQKIGNEQLAFQKKQTAQILSNYALNRPGLNFNNRGLFMPQLMQSPMVNPFNNPYNRMPTMHRQQQGYLPQQQTNMMVQAPQQHNNGYQVFPSQPLQNQPLLNNNPATINIELNSLQSAQQSLRVQLCNTHIAIEALQYMNLLERNEQRIKYLQMQLQAQQAATAAAANNNSIIVNPIQPENNVAVGQSSYVQPVPTNPLGQIQQHQPSVIIPQTYQQPQIQQQQQLFHQPMMVVQPQQPQFGFQPVGYVQPQPQQVQIQMGQGVILPGFQQPNNNVIGFPQQGFQQVQQPMYQQNYY